MTPCSPLRFDLGWRLDAGEKQTEVVALQQQPLVGLAEIPAIRRRLGERVISTLSCPSRSVWYGRRTPVSGRSATEKKGHERPFPKQAADASVRPYPVVQQRCVDVSFRAAAR